jgi:hypothetical protein
MAPGDLGKAIEELERAIAILEHRSGEQSLLPEAQFAPAQALWGAGRERPRGRSLAQAARQYEPIPAAVDAWLAKHR